MPATEYVAAAALIAAAITRGVAALQRLAAAQTDEEKDWLLAAYRAQSAEQDVELNDLAAKAQARIEARQS